MIESEHILGFLFKLHKIITIMKLSLHMTENRPDVIYVHFAHKFNFFPSKIIEKEVIHSLPTWLTFHSWISSANIVLYSHLNYL